MGTEGIEPPHAALEAASLPLAYAPNNTNGHHGEIPQRNFVGMNLFMPSLRTLNIQGHKSLYIFL